MAWLAGAAGTSGAAGGAAAGAAGSAAGAGAAASTAVPAALGTSAAGSSAAGIGAGTGAATTSAAGASGAATGAGATAAKGIGSSAAKDFIKDTAKDAAQSTISNEINRDDSVNPISNTFDPSGIASDENNKFNIQSASFQKHEVKKPQKEKLPGVDLLHGVVDGVNDLVASDGTKKENISNVSKSSLSRFNDTMKRLGKDLGAYAKEEGKNLISQAIASSAQPQPVNPVSPGFTGAQISSDENLKEDIEDAGGIIPMMAQIDSYLYKYKPEAQEEYAGTGMMNDDNNLGVMAQELQENPLTAPAVKTDEKGNLALDTGRLTSINTAMIAELCKKVMELEGQMYGRS
jgi:hypothetical protein